MHNSVDHSMWFVLWKALLWYLIKKKLRTTIFKTSIYSSNIPSHLIYTLSIYILFNFDRGIMHNAHGFIQQVNYNFNCLFLLNIQFIRSQVVISNNRTCKKLMSSWARNTLNKLDDSLSILLYVWFLVCSPNSLPFQMIYWISILTLVL